MRTNVGDIVLDLFEEKAPITVANFLDYVNDGYYDGLIFHRVISGFMIQGGGFEVDMVHKPTKRPIKNEAHKMLKNKKGTISMARTNIVDSATSQFFINLNDNHFLNYKNDNQYGYAVFGEVTKGMDVVELIGQKKTGLKGRYSDVPLEPIEILSVEVLKN